MGALRSGRRVGCHRSQYLSSHEAVAYAIMPTVYLRLQDEWAGVCDNGEQVSAWG